MVKRKKKKKLSIRKISIFLIIVAILSTLFIYKNKIRNYYLSKTTGYEESTIEVFMNNNLFNDISNDKYSKTLEKIVGTKYFDKTYLDEYIEIKYHETKDFNSNITQLLKLGYKSNDINQIYDNLKDESIKLLIDNKYIKDITNIISLEYFKENNLERYIKYYTGNEYDTKTAITYVNIGLDNKYYTEVTEVKNQDDILVLANKYNKLKSNYVPSDLKVINYKYQWAGRGNELRNDAATAFEEMCAAALKDNIYIYAGSGYRSYQTQLYLYNNYVATDGFTAAETYSARAGYSEHQTGLAMDIANSSGFISEGNKEYTWLIDNSYKYGFILRYPKGKQFVTGYMYEEWHYRYVGKEIATKIKELDITFDEYAARYL